MKNLYISTKNNLQLLVAIVFLLGGLVSANAQVRVGFTQRTSSYTPTKKIYNLKGNFTMMGNTCLTPQNYGNNTNNNGQYMRYVDTDGNPNTLNSSASTLVLSTENGAVPSCSNIVYAGLYWTGKSSANNTFNVTKTVPISGTETINNNITVGHNQNIANTDYSLAVGRNNPSSNNRNPYYNFTGDGNTYRFNFYNSDATNRVTLSVNGGTATNVPVVISAGNTLATFNTPYVITDGSVTITIKSLTRNAATNLETNTTQNSSFAGVNVAGTVTGNLTVTKNFDKRIISLKGPNAAAYTQFTAGMNDIYYPSGSDDDIYSAYTEITDYVRTNGIGQYWAADMALLEGNVGGTGYAGGWGIIVVYENSKMKYRDVTIFDGYAYVNSGENSALNLPVTGFNTVQSGNVGMTLGIMASEGDVDFTGDFFRVRKLNTGNYQTLNHGGSTATNFFNSAINAPGARNPQLQNNTAIDIIMTDVPNANNSVIGNNQTSTNFQYGTDGDTYSIFAIAMAVDAYIPDSDGQISAVTINGQPAGAGPYTALPGQDLEYKIQIRNKGTEAINNFKITIPVPYNTTYVPGSVSKNVYFTPLPTPNNLTFEPTIGANGSLVWDFGTLPLPANPETLLADMKFKFKVTTDCTLLKNTNCNNVVAVNGIMSGTGAITNIALANKSLIQGYTTSGNCQGIEIAAPILVNVNAQDYVNQNCQAVPPITAFFICNSGPTIPITEVSGAFPPGSTFYNEFPVVSGQTIQYTINNPFPSIVGTSTYYSVPPGVLNGCYFQFTITVTTITTQPTVANVQYCQNAAASPLTATPSVPGYTLYYYTALNGSPQLSITPSTATVGQTTYWVSEAQSSTCIGPKKPIVVTVSPYVVPAFDINDSVCFGTTAPVLPTTSTNGISGTWSPATISNTADGAYVFTPNAGQCATETVTVNITVNAVTPTFSIPQSICSGAAAPALPTTSDNGVAGTWSPATVDNTATATYTFTPSAGQCAAEPVTVMVTVNAVTPTFSIPQSICSGAAAPALPATSDNGVAGTWSPATVDNTATATYTFTPSDGQCATEPVTVMVTVNAVTPTFSIPQSICSGAAAPALPATSDNGVAGTWSPATVDNTATATYTFTPSDGQCATEPVTVMVTVNAVTPTFSIPQSICSGAAAPALPATSDNGVAGTWSPATVDNTATGTYTFTPSAGQCAAEPVTVMVTVNAVTPTFSIPQSICSGAAAPALPATSDNGVAGTWSPATVDNTATATYTFTPSDGQCATEPVTVMVTVNAVTPTFSIPQSICSGAAAPALPATSDNGVAGTWSPATVDNTATGTYTFTPSDGQCATEPVTVAVTVNAVTPTFSIPQSICSGAAAPALPATSDNGVAGTWSPATVDNTATATYTFTPSDGQCATEPVTVAVTVNAVTPTFSIPQSICSGAAAPALPATSDNGVAGTWSPATVDNTATGTYTFTPSDGQCATEPVSVTVTVNPIDATFAPIAPICSGETAPVLPATSQEGITGTWSPATVSNTATGTYIFTPTAGQCATATASLTVIVKPINATFAPIVPICRGDVAPILPTTSLEGVHGTWSPATVDNTQTGIYVFTPNAGEGQCATGTVSMTIVVNQLVAVFSFDNNICSGETAPVLPPASDNGIDGTWSPATVSNTTTGIYTFTPSVGQCATEPVTVAVTVNAISATFVPIAPICSGETAPVLPTTSQEGITGTWSPATVSNTATGTYIFTPTAGQCATATASLTVIVKPINATFAPIAPICRGDVAPILPTTSLEGVHGTWSPATVDNTQTGIYVFTPNAGEGQCATGTVSMTIVVNQLVAVFGFDDNICSGEAAPVLPLASDNGINGTWSPATVDNTATAIYTFTPSDGQCATEPVTVTVTVNQLAAVFGFDDNICSGEAAPVLPLTSDNGINGTWSPATVDNTATAIYTFTPSDGQCATEPVTVTVTVNQLAAVFGFDDNICSGEAAPVLPLTSDNGINGTWSPATVDNTATAIYTFTPSDGQCATEPVTVTVTVNQLAAVFGFDDNICSGEAAPVLPLASDNGINGTWSPATVDNTATAIYTFTPSDGQCATEPVTVTVTVNQLAAVFGFDDNICSGEAAPVLPLTSDNGINGTWSPATVDNTATAIYTFTPSDGQCATEPVTVTVTVNQLAAVFGFDDNICSGEAAPVLPLTSDNGINGTWSPATVDNTATAIYTFTPSDGQCATEPVTVTVTVNQLAAVFGFDDNICSGEAAPVLPLTSDNGINGTWSPATVDNTATAIYTFTPSDGQCATEPVTVTVTVNQLAAVFGFDDNICSGEAAPVLPLTSDNGINGTWSPATVDNTATAIYTFTPSDGQCATEPVTVTVTVNQLVAVFGFDDNICSGEAAPVLPLASDNGINGTWSPATVDNTATAIYTFTPSDGQCATEPVTVTVTVNPIDATFNPIAPICYGATAPVLPTISLEGIHGTWSPLTVSNTASGTYVFTPDAGQCATASVSVNVTVNVVAAPILSNITAQCSATVPTPALIDDCGTVLTAQSPDLQPVYDVQGTYIVHWNFLDAAGNIIVSTTQNVIVDDTEMPVFPTLLDLTGSCSVTAVPPTTTDLCAGTITATTVDNLTYNTQGTFIIHWIFDDGNGNVLPVNQTVIVDDTTAPVTPDLAPIAGSCSVIVPTPVTTDGCTTGDIIGSTLDPLVYGPGTYTVHWSFDDGNGNIATADQQVTVTDESIVLSQTGYLKCATDISLNIDLNTLLGTLPAGGTWSDLSTTGHFNAATGIFNPNGEMQAGYYDFQYVVNDGACTQTLNVEVQIDSDCGTLPAESCEPIVHNAFSPNNDGTNEWFQIDNFGDLDCVPTNTVEIYNRWGILVFETNQYDNNTKVFRGQSEGRTNVGGDSLPTGTYFYIINYMYNNANGSEAPANYVSGHQEGYLYLSK